MPAVRLPGTHNQIDQPVSNDSGTLYRGASPTTGPHGKGGTGLDALTTEQRAIVLDVTQFTLDIVGIFEPTPFADSTNAMISIGRGDWIGAGISAISVVPYVGDLAKAGKFSRYVVSFEKMMQQVKTDGKFSVYMAPVLSNLRTMMVKLDIGMVPSAARQAVLKVRQTLLTGDHYVGRKFILLSRKGACLLDVAKKVPLHANRRPVALYFGVDGSKLGKEFATIDAMLGESAVGRQLLAKLKTLPWKEQEEVWWILSERVSTIGTGGAGKVHVFVPVEYHKVLKMDADQFAKQWSKQERVWEEGDRLSAATVHGFKYRVDHATGKEVPQAVIHRYEDRVFHKIEEMNIRGAEFHFMDEKGKELFHYWRNL